MNGEKTLEQLRAEKIDEATKNIREDADGREVKIDHLRKRVDALTYSPASEQRNQQGGPEDKLAEVLGRANANSGGAKAENLN